MKLIILLLITFNSYAEVNVNITRGSKVYKGKFKSIQKAQDWIDDNISNNSWGKKERWLKSEEVKDTSKCIEKRDIVPKEGKMYEECKLPKEYSILICNDEQTYSESDECFSIVEDMKAKKKDKLDKEKENNDVKNIKKLKRKWSQLNDNQKDKLIKYLLRNL